MVLGFLSAENNGLAFGQQFYSLSVIHEVMMMFSKNCVKPYMKLENGS